MGLLGLFSKKPGGALKKHAERVANKRAQAVDRWDSIQALVRDGSVESVEALLPRLSFYVDPSITDQEEKDSVFSGILRVGKPAIPAVIRFMETSESLSWPLKILDQLASPGEVAAVLLELLEPMDTEYERDPQRKIQLLSALEERPDTNTASKVVRFLRDANETVRFVSVGALLVQDDESIRDALLECLCAEESVRVRNRVLEGFSKRGWRVAERLDEVRRVLTPGFAADANGTIRKLA